MRKGRDCAAGYSLEESCRKKRSDKREGTAGSRERAPAGDEAFRRRAFGRRESFASDRLGTDP